MTIRKLHIRVGSFKVACQRGVGARGIGNSGAVTVDEFLSLPSEERCARCERSALLRKAVARRAAATNATA